MDKFDSRRDLVLFLLLAYYMSLLGVGEDTSEPFLSTLNVRAIYNLKDSPPPISFQPSIFFPPSI